MLQTKADIEVGQQTFSAEQAAAEWDDGRRRSSLQDQGRRSHRAARGVLGRLELHFNFVRAWSAQKKKGY